jgi:apolipoprotein D and lipocalin family protein
LNGGQRSALKMIVIPRLDKNDATGTDIASSSGGMKLKEVAFLLGMVGAGFGEVHTDLQTVRTVDLNRYMGKWYEIARYPNRFEKKCVSDITAEYTLRADGKVLVVNSCRKMDGNWNVSRGTAKVVDKQTNAKLKVTFFWPFYGDYWVIDLDPDYRFAVVSDPARKYLWILSRTPQMDRLTYERIRARIREKGFDPARLIQPAQSAGR